VIEGTTIVALLAALAVELRRLAGLFAGKERASAVVRIIWIMHAVCMICVGTYLGTKLSNDLDFTHDLLEAFLFGASPDILISLVPTVIGRLLGLERSTGTRPSGKAQSEDESLPPTVQFQRGRGAKRREGPPPQNTGGMKKLYDYFSSMFRSS